MKPCGQQGVKITLPAHTQCAGHVAGPSKATFMYLSDTLLPLRERRKLRLREIKGLDFYLLGVQGLWAPSTRLFLNQTWPPLKVSPCQRHCYSERHTSDLKILKCMVGKKKEHGNCVLRHIFLDGHTSIN